MTFAPNLESDIHIIEIFDKALNSPHGITILFPSKAKATTFRHTAYSVRKRDRIRRERMVRENKDAAPSGESLISPYEALKLVISSDPIMTDKGAERWAVKIIHTSHVLAQLEIIENQPEEAKP